MVAKFGGYYLPWPGGLKKQLTWSIAHSSCANDYCHYAFDFADGTMFPLLAAKGGEVFAAKWDCNNGSTSCTNYMILKDNSTTPTTYQIYYHLANGSIPAALRVKGTRVTQGQFIGNVDDTGASTAHHLHFMVHASTYGYWGQSVDITFKDVSINYDSVTQGGRPRLGYEATKYGGQGQTYYVSGNRPANAPTGNLSTPAAGQVFTTNNLVVSGKGQDDKGITKVQAIAYYNDAWHDIGQPVTTASFSIPVDMCAAGNTIPDGPVVIAVNLFDVEGNQSYGFVGFRGITKNFNCASTPSSPAVVPACVPAAGQVALYSQPAYTGNCRVFDAGDYANRTSMGTFSGNNVASVLAGSSAQVTLYSKATYNGRAETLVSSDPDLGDNLLNEGIFNSFQVHAKSRLPSVPEIGYPAAGAVLNTADSVILSWYNKGAADEFQVAIAGPQGFTPRVSGWMRELSWSLGSLPAGPYSWSVLARNSGNGLTSAPVSGSFTVNSATVDVIEAWQVPFTEDAENGLNGWSATGLWQQTTARASSGTHSWLYGETVNSVLQYNTGFRGALTSPAIAIPASGYYLRFDYRYKTESAARFWDQRRVQISRDGGDFGDVYRSADDPMGYWLTSPAIDLSAYAGSTIRIRFLFDTIDKELNSGDGWYIDNIRVDTNAPQTGCNEPVANQTIADSIELTTANPAKGDICPSGDVDYYSFTMEAGQTATFDVDAKTIGSELDPYLFLIGRDGRTVLAESDDEVAYEVKDSLITYTFSEAGTYYLRLQAWDNPKYGGSDYFYILKMVSDTTPPTASFTYPAGSQLLPNTQVNLRVQAADNNGGSGLSHVIFFWHDHDWYTGKWTRVGEDWDGSDGWSVIFDATKPARGDSGAFYAQVFDRAGNWSAASAWSIATDPSQPAPAKPTSALLPLPGDSNVNTVLLQWNATDAGAGISAFEFQVQENGGAWTGWQPPDGVSPLDRSAWFIGVPGKTYGFRMRLLDAAGNKEEYPSLAETTVRLAGCSGAADLFEEDDSMAAAGELLEGGARQARTFCGQDDADWARLQLLPGELYMVNALPLSATSAAVITVYDSSGSPVAEKFPEQLGAPVTLAWSPPDAKDYYVRVRNFNPLIAGDGTGYQLWLDSGIKNFVPLVVP